MTMTIEEMKNYIAEELKEERAKMLRIDFTMEVFQSEQY